LLYTLVVEVEVGFLDREGIDFTDLDVTLVIYPSDADVAPTVFVSSYDWVFVNQVHVNFAGIRRHPVDFLLSTTEDLKETSIVMGHSNQEVGTLLP
jgi:ABC-type nitrate/sulfonate/bicarbonate transport system substrate-binding protein